MTHHIVYSFRPLGEGVEDGFVSRGASIGIVFPRSCIAAATLQSNCLVAVPTEYARHVGDDAFRQAVLCLGPRVTPPCLSGL
jgi:hypothetical protein